MGLFKKKRDPKAIFPKSEYIINFAFSVGGIDYYQFDDIFSLPYERGLAAVAIYNELDMRCSRDYLLKHTQAVTDILKSPEIDIYRINELNNQMKQRLQLTTDVDLLYRLASVVYFDRNENPAVYEEDYSKSKIDNWLKNKGTKDFFLQKPLCELIPFLKNVDLDLDEYTEINRHLNELHLEKLHSLTSKKG